MFAPVTVNVFPSTLVGHRRVSLNLLRPTVGQSKQLLGDFTDTVLFPTRVHHICSMCVCVCVCVCAGCVPVISCGMYGDPFSTFNHCNRKIALMLMMLKHAPIERCSLSHYLDQMRVETFGTVVSLGSLFWHP